tara:strand:- start:1980 stop:2306 length:327 start_codon:yes stop_codon:yes gene_type:complete
VASKERLARIIKINMLFQVGDLVKRVHPPHDYWLGIVVKIETVNSKAIQFPACKNQTYETIWVKWMNIGTPETRLSMAWEPESYWAEDLEVVSSVSGGGSRGRGKRNK